MRYRIYILLTLLTIMMSCNKWLDVQPSGIVTSDQMFEEGIGYRNALNGIYKTMSSPSLYGRELLWGALSACGGDFDHGYSGVGYYHYYTLLASDYKYKDVKCLDMFKSIWGKAYFSIVNCNNLLGDIKDEPSSKFKLGSIEKDLIIGEATALRAMMHFDLLRLFAPAKVKDDGKNYIPYYKQEGLSTGSPAISVDKALSNIIADLKVARDLVAKYDTTDVSRKNMLDQGFRFTYLYDSGIENKDSFISCRGYRMNYLAITAILARVYNYAGQHDLAYELASEIINVRNKGGYSLFTFTYETDIIKGNKKMYNDLIFCLADPKLIDNYTMYTTNSVTSSDGIAYLAINSSVINNYDDNGDFRKKYFFFLGQGNKQLSNKSTDPCIDIVKDMLPIIRLSEMYYILAEYYANNSQFDNAIEALDVVRMGRGCTKGRLSINSMEKFKEEMIKEARREFVCEGQTFFYYKKYNIKVNPKMKDEHFYFPIPEEENVTPN